MHNIANIRLHSALKDAVDAMISGTGLKGKETGNRIDLFDHTGNQWGSVEEAQPNEDGPRYLYKSSVCGDEVTGNFDSVTNHIHDDMANSWEYHTVPQGEFADALESIQDETLKTALTESFIVCHKKAALESQSGNAKRKWINKIYAAAEPLLKGIKRDNNWENVHQLFETIKTAVPEVQFTVGAKDGGYGTNRDGGKFKTYTIEGTTPEGFPIKGSLVCSFCGTVEDPMSAYDMSLILN